MDLRAGQVDAFVRRPPAGLRAALLYGPDLGLVRERAEAMIKANAVSLRSDIMAMVSEYNFATASRPEFKDELAARIRDHVNGIMRTKAPIRILVDEVLLTRVIAN